MYTFLLLEKFLDGPKRGEGEDTQQGREEDVGHAERGDRTCYSQEEENPPATLTPVVFGLDDHRMEQTDDEKRGDADSESFPMHAYYSVSVFTPD